MPSQGGPARQITSRPGFDWFPSWSPDGRSIAFQSQSQGTDGNSTYIVPSGGGEPRLLFIGREGGTACWSPDGRWLAGARQGRLYRVPVDGAPPEGLATPHRVNSTQFSRDGASIYYSVVTGPAEDHDLWKFSHASGTTSRLTKLAGPRGQIGYVFSADDRYLYFIWVEDDGDIFVMDVANTT